MPVLAHPTRTRICGSSESVADYSAVREGAISSRLISRSPQGFTQTRGRAHTERTWRQGRAPPLSERRTRRGAPGEERRRSRAASTARVHGPLRRPLGAARRPVWRRRRRNGVPLREGSKVALYCEGPEQLFTRLKSHAWITLGYYRPFKEP